MTYGNKLPSKRLLAEETGVSVITIEHTYSILCDEGYIESRQRSGYYVIYRESEFLSVHETGIASESILNHGTTHVKKAAQIKCEFSFFVSEKTVSSFFFETVNSES